jgi:SMI1 / KNR4 family (SUKH-1)
VLGAAEHTLHFSLPPLLRRLYIEVGNGGFGPGYGLLGLEGGALSDGYTIVDLYQAFRTPDAHDPAWHWPAGLLPICHLGCAMYACTDCTTPEGAIIWFEPNPREPGEPLQRFLIPAAPSLAAWLAAWLRDEDWYTAAYEKSELKQWNEENAQ